MIKVSLKSSLLLVNAIAHFLETCNEEWGNEGKGKQDFYDVSADLGARIAESEAQDFSYHRPPNTKPWEYRDAGFCAKSQSRQTMSSCSQGSKTIELATKRHSDYRLKEQSLPKVLPICPLCDNEMKFRSARQGGLFYGCSTWPKCNGYRKPDGSSPGPKNAVNALKQSMGVARFDLVEECKRAGRMPPPLEPDAPELQ